MSFTRGHRMPHRHRWYGLHKEGANDDDILWFYPYRRARVHAFWCERLDAREEIVRGTATSARTYYHHTFSKTYLTELHELSQYWLEGPIRKDNRDDEPMPKRDLQKCWVRDPTLHFLYWKSAPDRLSYHLQYKWESPRQETVAGNAWLLLFFA